MTDAQAADLMSFCASEFHTFFGHLGNCITTFKTTGKVPPSIFKTSGHSGSAGASKADKPKSKRRPTAFNMFVKQKMEELKQSGIHLDGDKNNNGMFTMAVGQWKHMSDQDKADYTAKFKAELQEGDGELQDAELAAEIPDVPSPTAAAAAAAAPAEVQKVKKKRKKTENAEAPAAAAEAKPAAAAPEPAPESARAEDAADGSEKKHKKHKKDKSHKKDKFHKRDRKEAAE